MQDLSTLWYINIYYQKEYGQMHAFQECPAECMFPYQLEKSERDHLLYKPNWTML